MSLADSLKYDKDGLVTAVVQDAEGGDVLMVASMNRQAVEESVRTGKAHYWSRSRGKLWFKGETSGHFQNIREIRIDCDADALLLLVDQELAACHEGYRSCFFRRASPEGRLEAIAPRIFDPGEVYGGKK